MIVLESVLHHCCSTVTSPPRGSQSACPEHTVISRSGDFTVLVLVRLRVSSSTGGEVSDLSSIRSEGVQAGSNTWPFWPGYPVLVRFAEVSLALWSSPDTASCGGSWFFSSVPTVIVGSLTCSATPISDILSAELLFCHVPSLVPPISLPSFSLELASNWSMHLGGRPGIIRQCPYQKNPAEKAPGHQLTRDW